MLRKIITAVSIAILVLISIPFIAGVINDPEVSQLNEETRKELYGKFIELSDGWTHYDEMGDGRAGTVVLVHGNSSPYFSFDNNVDALAKAGFRVIRYDIFGHGFSGRPETKFDHVLYDRQLLELMNKLKLTKPVHLAGTSQGGSIAAYFTAMHPKRVDRLVLLSPLMDEFTAMKSLWLKLTKSFVGNYMKAVFLDKMSLKKCRAVFVSPDKVEEFKKKYKLQMKYRGWKRAKLSNIREMNLGVITRAFETIGRHNRKIMLVWGDRDTLIPESSVKRTRKVLPGAEYHQLSGAGHIAHYEFPERVNPLLVGFLKK